jgi:hypothetical protein
MAPRIAHRGVLGPSSSTARLPEVCNILAHWQSPKTRRFASPMQVDAFGFVGSSMKRGRNLALAK